ncbi:hypothetical protein ABID14_000814 [Peptoniphilus olsenii]|uniref:Uncharacterized protein n=1 Tax=Peptoniphilus olsenii TaxID=411570 RepID=A0ABV2JAC0_9FIRM
MNDIRTDEIYQTNMLNRLGIHDIKKTFHEEFTTLQGKNYVIDEYNFLDIDLDKLDSDKFMNFQEFKKSSIYKDIKYCKEMKKYLNSFKKDSIKVYIYRRGNLVYHNEDFGNKNIIITFLDLDKSNITVINFVKKSYI